jgi:hypothetical protein
MDRGRIMSEEERKEILDWIYLNKSNFLPIKNNRLHYLILEHEDDINTSGMNSDKLPAYNPNLPRSVWKIKQRIIEKENVAEYKQEPVFQDFIAVIPPTGYIHKHRDPNEGNLIHCRFNVFLEIPTKGGDTYYDDRLVMDPKEGSYILSKSGIEEHYTYPIEEGNRISISFGILIPKERVDTMTSSDKTIERHYVDFTKIHTLNPDSNSYVSTTPYVKVRTHFDLFKELLSKSPTKTEDYVN